MDRIPKHIYLGFGSNLGDREDYLRQACELLAGRGYSIMRISLLYETEPWGGAEGEAYLNAVIELELMGSPRELLSTIQSIENTLGRTRSHRYAPRTCDLDILLWGNAHIDSADLIVPHPRMTERRFVLRPLCDLINDLHHPLLGKSFGALLAAVRDELEVRSYQYKPAAEPV